MRILSFYNNILSLGSLTSDVEGKVSVVIDGNSRPFTIDGKRVMLPTPNVIQMTDKSNIQIFHPLQEHTTGGESVVLRKYRDAINLTLNMRLHVLLGEIIQLAASPAQHQLLKPEHYGLMGVLKDADAKTFEAWEHLRKAMPAGDIEHSVVHTFIKKSAEIRGRNYRRGAIVSFPLYEEIARASGDDNHKGTGTVWGVKLRKKDLAAFKALLEAIFPDISEKNSYSRGGPSITAPALDALLRASKDLVGQINTVVETFEPVVDVSDLRYSDDWVEDAVNLDTFEGELRLIPMQVGNEPTYAAETQKPAAAAAASSGTVTMAQLGPVVGGPGAYPAVAAPSTTSPPQGSAAPGTVTMQEILAQSPQLASAGAMMIPGAAGYGYPGMNAFGQQGGAQALRQQQPSWANPGLQFQNARF